MLWLVDNPICANKGFFKDFNLPLVEILCKTYFVLTIMSKIISQKLEEGIDREIDKMPYGLSKRQVRRLADKALDRVIKRVSRNLGIANANVENVKQIFWECNQSFPNYDDECYIQAMQGAEGGRIRPLGFFEKINKPRIKDLRDFSNDILFNDEWGANYDPQTQTMLGGYSEDGKYFRPTFRITEIEEDDVPSALAMYVQLRSTSKLDKIDTTFDFLVELYQKCHSKEVRKVIV